jgi:hypothetical protein
MIRDVPLPLLALAFAVALIVLVPTRRLFVAGWSRGALSIYFTIVWLLTLLVAWGPGRTSLLVAPLVIAWLMPYLAPWLRARPRPGRQQRRPPPKNVTPPDAR